VRPLENGKFLIAPPVQESSTRTGGKWERAIKQWLATRLKSTEGESRRVFEYGQKFIGGVFFGIGRLFLVLMVAAFILIDLDRIQGFLRSLVPERYQVDYDRIYVGIDRGLSGVIRGQLRHLPHQRLLHLHRAAAFTVKYPLLLAAIAATMSLIPIFGSILSSFPSSRSR
jgi:predicted PurR-regulated permease PerM